jgi:APA family basic amino acid/polyamine antiporter
VAENESAPRRKAMGLGSATALVVGNMIGSGVFLLPASLAAYGGISIVGWCFTAAGSLLLALTFASLSRRGAATGGPYAYSRRAFGDFTGFQVAWGYWIAVWTGNAAIVVAGVGYLAYFFPRLAHSNLAGAVVALAGVWLFTLVNLAGVRQGARIQNLTTVAKLIPLGAIAFIGPFFLRAHNFHPFNASGGTSFHAVTATATLTLWAFIGLESATVPAGDVKDPERTIARSTVIGTLIAAVIYILGTVAVLGVVDRARLASSTAPFADAAREIFGHWAGGIVAVGAIISAFGALNGWTLLQGQVPMAAADDCLFPRFFARRTRNGTPAIALVVSSVLVSVLLLSNYNSSLVDQFTFIILLATLTTLVPYAYSAAAELYLLATGAAERSWRRIARPLVVAALAFAYSLWAIGGAGYQVVFRGFLLLLGGIPVYVLLVARRTKSAATVTKELS